MPRHRTDTGRSRRSDEGVALWACRPGDGRRIAALASEADGPAPAEAWCFELRLRTGLERGYLVARSGRAVGFVMLSSPASSEALIVRDLRLLPPHATHGMLVTVLAAVLAREGMTRARRFEIAPCCPLAVRRAAWALAAGTRDISSHRRPTTR